ncbi:MAG: hypothetical protein ACJAQT_002815 [Akkermansiaceae bacterium]|jgi:hypothetical protein
MAGLLSVTPVLAQGTGVPSKMSYQAIVTDDAGDPLAPAVAESYEITMRIFDAATEGNLIWSEKQITEVFQGRFSVILGIGQAVPVAGGGFEPNPDLATVFSGKDRFTEITVRENVAGTVSKTLAPRQQMMATATAFRAKVAESLGTSSNTALTVLDSGNVGIGTTAPDGKLDVSGLLRVQEGSTINAGRIALGNRGLNNYMDTGIFRGGLGSLTGGNTLNLASYGGIAFNSSAQAAGAQETRMYIEGTNGNVGIGTTAPIAKLNVVNSGSGNTAVFQASGKGGEASYIQNGPNGDIYWRSANPAGKVILQDTGGNVGIGTSTPASPLTVKTGLNTNIGFEHTNGTIRVGTYVGGSSGGGWLGTFSNHPLSLFVNNGSPIVTIATSGNVGIGTASPGNKLDVIGGISSSGLVTGDVNMGRPRIRGINREKGIGGLYLEWGNQAPGSYGQSFIVNQKEAGNDGIFLGEAGTPIRPSFFTSPASSTIYGNLVVNGSGGSENIPGHGYLNAGETGVGGAVNGITGISIKASGAVHASLFRALSDARIKNITGRSDGEADLAVLKQIEITDYTHKDVISKGTASSKKVIAQQVEKVFPQAVAKTVDVVPDIYTKAPVEEGWITLATDLKKGERVRLISTTKDEIVEVLEVEKDRFRAEFDLEEEEALFVYGREVKDFRAVDYEAIAMLNVSATQELHRRLEAKDKEVEALKSRLNAMDEKMGKVLALLSADRSKSTQPVSLTSEPVSK